MSGSSTPSAPAELAGFAGTGDRLLVAEEVAELLAVRVSWVREATRAGHLPHVRLGRYVRYERAAVAAWVADQRAHGLGVP